MLFVLSEVLLLSLQSLWKWWLEIRDGGKVFQKWRIPCDSCNVTAACVLSGCLQRVLCYEYLTLQKLLSIFTVKDTEYRFITSNLIYFW